MDKTTDNLLALWIALDKSQKFTNPQIARQPGGYVCSTSLPSQNFYLGITAAEAVRKIREIHGYKNLPI